jgi:soluble lytic murein transglycosylase-like protein
MDIGRIFGCIALVVACASAGAQDRQYSPRETYAPIIEEAALAYGVEPALLDAVVLVESSYDARAVSRQGAQGLMQLMPETARRYGVANAFDPVQNLRGGARYLRDLQETFNDDLQLVLAAYHAGEYAVIRHGYRMPPVKSTLDYVTRVLQRYRHNLRAEMLMR